MFKKSSLSKLSENKFPILISLLVLVFVLIFVLRFVGQEKYIYFWDYSTYFGFFNELGAKFTQTPFKALDSIFISIRKADYNISGVVPLLPFYFLFGSGRASYISSIAIIYVFPLIVFFPFFVEKTFNFKKPSTVFDRSLFYLALVIVIGFTPQLWAAVLLGYLDVVGVGIIFLILYFFFEKKLSEHSLKKLILLGILLSLLIIVRRWYAYWVIGFFAAATFQIIFDVYASKERFNTLKTSLKNLVIIGLSAVILFFALATQIAVRMLTTDYKDIYSAYRNTGSDFQDFIGLYNHFGLLTLAICFAGLILSLLKKDLRNYGIFLFVLPAATFLLFTRTQSIDIHHYYWVFSILVIFAGIFVREIFSGIKSVRVKIGALLILLIVCLANFAIVFFPGAENILQPAAFALPKIRIYPKTRNDFQQIHLLLTELNKLTINSSKKIYVLSSSLSLNGSLLKNACFYFEPDLTELNKKILQSHDVDKRDGFPFHLLTADYVVVAEPYGYHLAPKDQKVIIIPAHEILYKKNFGQAYEKLPFEVILDDNRRVFIFQKSRKFDNRELEKLSIMFARFYPQYKEKFAIDETLIKSLSEN